MDTWEKLGLIVAVCVVIGALERQLNHIIGLLQEIRDRLPRNE